ncbi:MAG: hypothetical protein Q9169_005407 [Polycauliona sp. 2 TL-2023]
MNSLHSPVLRSEIALHGHHTESGTPETASSSSNPVAITDLSGLTSDQSRSLTEASPSTASVASSERNTREQEPPSLDLRTQGPDDAAPGPGQVSTSAPLRSCDPKVSAKRSQPESAQDLESSLTSGDHHDRPVPITTRSLESPQAKPSSTSGHQSSQSPSVDHSLDQTSLELHHGSASDQQSGRAPSPPQPLEDLVSPLFLKRFISPETAPTDYEPKFTSSLFRRVYRACYNQYDREQEPNGLLSYFDLEMTAPEPPTGGSTKRNPQWVKDRLAEYGIVQCQNNVYKSYPELAKAVKGILDAPRTSIVSDIENERLAAKQDLYQTSNEDTYMYHVFPFYNTGGRLVPAFENSDNEEREQIRRDFDIDGMVTHINANYTQSVWFFDQTTEKLSDEINTAMMKDAHLTNPRPDMAFGISRQSLPWPEGEPIPSDYAKIFQLIVGNFHIFLIVEAKSHAGDVDEARNQTARGAAIAINNHRQARRLLGLSDLPGADTETMVFSVVVTPNLVEFAIHWAEVPKDPNLHQSRLANQAHAKSSPHYVNGENIHLEDVPTDSDEDDSDYEEDKKAKGAILLSWVQLPMPNNLPREQEKNNDANSIFGPLAAVNMEEMFKEEGACVDGGGLNCQGFAG